VKTRCALIATLIASLTPVEVDAHGLAAGFLSVETTDDHKGEVLLKLPEVEGNTPELQVIFGASCEELGPPTRIRRNDGVIKRWSVRCEQPLTGMRIELQGLNAVLGEVFVEFHSPTETEWNALVRRGQPLTILGAQAGHGADVRGDYFTLGVEHILSGFDHLLFVLALILIVYRARAVAGRRAVARTMLLTITAFTIGHSLTLAAATLELVRLPQAPVELAIVLSVLLLAVELARDDPRTLTMRFPAFIALLFGLLHGFGFASALVDNGLPPDGVALPLLLFNLGVEAGELIVVLAALLAMSVSGMIAARLALPARYHRHFRTLLIYGVGTITAYWCLERSLGWIAV